MRAVVITQKRMVTGLCGLLAFAAAVLLAFHGVPALLASFTQRQMPICRVQTQEKKIAVTFDMDSGNKDTARLADILRRYGVKATFFVVGAWAQRYPQSLRALSADGHEIGNHSDTHPHMPRLSGAEMLRQITECNGKIRSVTGNTPVLFRAPYDDYSNLLIDTARAASMQCIQWSVDSLDWKNPAPNEIKKRVLAQAEPGSILLFHNGALNTATALPDILSALQTQGYSMVPVSQLIYHDHYRIDETGTQKRTETDDPDRSS